MIFQEKFEIKLIFLIKPFRYITKESRQKLKYLENEKSFIGKIKSIFHHFKGLSDSKNCLRSESTSLKQNWLAILAGDLKIIFNLQYDHILSVEFSRRFLFSNNR